jgi:4-amino-4-deoxy-L-arabinose transferase-like glycosyltransferase
MPLLPVRQPWLQIPPAFWMLLLIPLLTILPPVPIDETRYLSVAWEMRQTGSWVTLHLNGVPYFDKPPLLFWLINASWSLFGVSLWAARLMVVLCGVGCVALCQWLDRLLAPGDAPRAGWFLLGSLFLVLFSSVVMFDVLLCLCVLLGFVSMASYVRSGNRLALLGLFAAAALGVLAKGPVALLHLAGPILLAPWWSAVGERRVSWKSVLAMLVVALLGGLPALAWAQAAVHYLSEADANELLLRQTAGRVVQSFAHNRSLWWYLPWLPLLLLPWTLLLRWRHVRRAAGVWRHSREARFGTAASLPAFLAFCVVSGKQLHYLLPLLPGVAMLLTAWLRSDAQLLSIRRLWVLWAVLVGVLVWAMFGAEPLGRGSMQRGTALGLYAVSGALLLLGALYLWIRRAPAVEHRAGFTALLLVLALLPLIRLQALGALDMRDLAYRVVELRAKGVPVIRTENEPGLITFLARLPQPLPRTDDLAKWAREHPDARVLVYGGRGGIPTDADLSVRLANGWVSLMSSEAVLAHPETISRWSTPAED